MIFQSIQYTFYFKSFNLVPCDSSAECPKGFPYCMGGWCGGKQEVWLILCLILWNQKFEMYCSFCDNCENFILIFCSLWLWLAMFNRKLYCWKMQYDDLSMFIEYYAMKFLIFESNTYHYQLIYIFQIRPTILCSLKVWKNLQRHR